MLSATAATRAPRGAVSVPLPRTPRENILSKTTKNNEGQNAGEAAGHLRVAVKALAVVWQARCVRDNGGLTPSSVRRKR